MTKEVDYHLPPLLVPPLLFRELGEIHCQPILTDGGHRPIPTVLS